jgi:hypothetical protein
MGQAQVCFFVFSEQHNTATHCRHPKISLQGITPSITYTMEIFPAIVFWRSQLKSFIIFLGRVLPYWLYLTAPVSEK